MLNWEQCSQQPTGDPIQKAQKSGAKFDALEQFNVSIVFQALKQDKME